MEPDFINQPIVDRLRSYTAQQFGQQYQQEFFTSYVGEERDSYIKDCLDINYFTTTEEIDDKDLGLVRKINLN